MPAIKYKDVLPGTLFTDAEGKHLYAMTFEKKEEAKVAIALTRPNEFTWVEEVGGMVRDKTHRPVINIGNIMSMFRVNNLRALGEIDCYEVVMDGPIKEIC